MYKYWTKVKCRLEEKKMRNASSPQNFERCKGKTRFVNTPKAKRTKCAVITAKCFAGFRATKAKRPSLKYYHVIDTSWIQHHWGANLLTRVSWPVSESYVTKCQVGAGWGRGKWGFGVRAKVKLHCPFRVLSSNNWIVLPLVLFSRMLIQIKDTDCVGVMERTTCSGVFGSPDYRVSKCS